MSRSKRKKNEETKRRFEAIKDLMSTFAMSTVAVVAAVTLIPASPKAEITRVVPLSDEVAYSVTITDEENALDLSTLFVVLENQLEYYEEPLSLGENTGYFENLESNTQYRLSIYGSKGFGQERLDTLKITTKEKIGGTILSVEKEQMDYDTTYLVDISINDPDEKYSSITLYYGYSYEPDTEIIYSTVPITNSRMMIELSDIYTSEDIHIYLEGITTDGSEILDEMTITPPYEFYASVYPNYIHHNEIGFSLYSDVDIGDNTRYEMNIYTNSQLIRTDYITLHESSHEHQGFIISDLSPNTTYFFECTAIYQNPQTLREEQQIIYEEEITTLDYYSFTYHIEDFIDYFEVTINVNDPSNYFQYAYYESYDTTDVYDIYLSGQTYLLEPLDTDKFITFTINTPTTDAYKITIGIRNQNDYSIYQIIELIVVD